VNDLKYAIPGAMLFCVLAVLLYLEGNSFARFFVLLALFAGALGQYAAQDPAAWQWARVLTYIGVLCTFAAMVIVALF
jgi:hypothetical protein